MHDDNDEWSDWSDGDFPPTRHPGREAFTATIVLGLIIMVCAALVWAAWKAV